MVKKSTFDHDVLIEYFTENVEQIVVFFIFAVCFHNHDKGMKTRMCGDNMLVGAC